MGLVKHIAGVLLVLVSAMPAWGDTFKHRQTGQVFHGFATQQQRQGKTLVFVAEEEVFKPISLSEYEVTIDGQGRREMVYVLPIDEPEILLSKTISEALAKRIVEIANQGPKLIVLAIDSPGGQGPYMRTVANTVLNTRNCPIVALVEGQKHGGAYSAAAAIALACEKVYVAPGAVLGSVAPLTGRTADARVTGAAAAGRVAGPSPEAEVALYSPDHLASYGAFMASLAERRKRPVMVARALVDRTIDLVEVEDLDGRRSYIDIKDRTTTQKVLRHLTQVFEPAHGDATGAGSSVSSARFVLTLTANQAKELGLVDGVVGSVEEIARLMGVEGSRIVRARPVDGVVRQYRGVRRNISQSLATIEQLQKRVDDLHQQATQLEQQIRQGTVEREVRQGDPGFYDYSRRSSRDRRRDPQRYYRDMMRRQYERGTGRRMETLRGEQPIVSPVVAYQQLGLALNELIREYRRVLNMGQRFPGALPLDVTVGSLQQRLDAAMALQNDVRRWMTGTPIVPRVPGVY